MFSSFMYTLRMFYGYAHLRTLLIGATALVVLALAAWVCAPFRGGLRSWTERGRWRGVVAGTGQAVFKLATILLITRFCMTILNRQAELFDGRHGRITDQNRSAVLMKWGHPHEQPEMSVRFTRERIWVTRQLQVAIRDQEPRVFSEGYWKDEEPPVQAANGILPTVLSVREEPRRVPVEQRGLEAADVAITVTSNPRRLGNANYAGYEDAWELVYRAANPSEWETIAHMTFNLPAKNGLFDAMAIAVDGQDALAVASTADDRIVWDAPMPPGSVRTVTISYRSRGLEHLRYIPKRMSPTGHYRVRVTVVGVDPAKLDYPIGSMPPSENLADIRIQPFTLTWTLDNALTSYDIGIRLPDAVQPEYHFARLLHEAPVAIVMLAVLLTLPRLLLARRVRPDVVLLLGAFACLSCTLMSHLADRLTGFAAPFALAVLITGAVVAVIRLLDRRDPMALRVQDTLAFVLATALYPLAVVDHDWTAFWMQWMLLVILVYLAELCVLAWRRPAAAS